MKKETKNKIIVSVISIIILTILNIYISTMIDILLTKKDVSIAEYQVIDMVKELYTNKKQLKLFVYIEVLMILFISYFTLIDYKTYVSSLNKITKNINTPSVAGQNQYGSARWLKEKEKDDVFNSVIIKKGLKINEGGLVLGLSEKDKKKGIEKVYFEKDDVHALCIGATGSGKSRTVVLQSICLLGMAGESMVISDPKGELFNYTSDFLEKEGYNVIPIDFKNPLKSKKYNFLEGIINAVDENDMPKAIEKIWDLVESLVPQDSHKEKIWVNGEASVLASAIMCVVYDNKEKERRHFRNMTNVFYFISQMCTPLPNGKGIPLEEYVSSLEEGHPARGLLAISEIAPKTTRGSFFTSALTTLKLFTNELIYDMTNGNDIELKEIGRKKTALFIILPDEKTTYYALASLFVNQIYVDLVEEADSIGGRLNRRVNFILDEFGNFTKISGFDNKLTVGRGRGIKFNLFIQALSQLDEKYNKEIASIIKSNCQNWIYLQSDDLGTREEISKKLGNYTTNSYSLNTNNQKYTNVSNSSSVNLMSRALLTSDEINMINRPDTLVTSRTSPCIMYAPDLIQWKFNKILGLGNKEHNVKVRKEREQRRISRNKKIKIDIWSPLENNCNLNEKVENIGEYVNYD